MSESMVSEQDLLLPALLDDLEEATCEDEIAAAAAAAAKHEATQESSPHLGVEFEDALLNFRQ